MKFFGYPGKKKTADTVSSEGAAPVPADAEKSAVTGNAPSAPSEKSASEPGKGRFSSAMSFAGNVAGNMAGDVAGRVASKTVKTAVSSAGLILASGVTGAANNTMLGKIAVGAATGAIAQVPGGAMAINVLGLNPAEDKEKQKKERRSQRLKTICTFLLGLFLGIIGRFLFLLIAG